MMRVIGEKKQGGSWAGKVSQHDVTTSSSDVILWESICTVLSVLSGMGICLPMLEVLEHSRNTSLNESKFMSVIYGRASKSVTHLRSNAKIHIRGKRWSRHHPSIHPSIRHWKNSECVLATSAESVILGGNSNSNGRSLICPLSQTRC